MRNGSSGCGASHNTASPNHRTSVSENSKPAVSEQIFSRRSTIASPTSFGWRNGYITVTCSGTPRAAPGSRRSRVSRMTVGISGTVISSAVSRSACMTEVISAVWREQHHFGPTTPTPLPQSGLDFAEREFSHDHSRTEKWRVELGEPSHIETNSGTTSLHLPIRPMCARGLLRRSRASRGGVELLGHGRERSTAEDGFHRKPEILGRPQGKVEARVVLASLEVADGLVVDAHGVRQVLP